MCIKKWWKRIFVAICLLCLACAVVVPTMVVGNSGTSKVVIDAGHGGLDGGVSSKNGVKESDLVLVLARLVGERLEGAGVKVVYTRKNKGALVGGKFIKKRDMEKRLAIIKRANPSLVVSIHLNSYKDKSRRGMQVFFGVEQSKGVAEHLQEQLNNHFNEPDVGRRFSVLQGDKYILNESPCPALIVECGFLSNPIDEQNLLSDTYRNQLAEVLCSSILSFVGE